MTEELLRCSLKGHHEGQERLLPDCLPSMNLIKHIRISQNVGKPETEKRRLQTIDSDGRNFSGTDKNDL